MASKFLDLAAPVAAALKVGTPIVAIETGFFMRLPYPKNYTALQECEQAFWRRDCVPCCVGVVDGRLKAGLTKEDLDKMCRAGGNAARGELPNLAADTDRALLYAARSVAVLRQDEVDALTDAYLLQRDLELTESSVIPCGETLGDLAEKASAAALDLKKKTDFR